MPSASASASSSPAAEPLTRCRPVRGEGAHLTLGPGAAPTSDDDEAVDLPFAPEIGGAAPFRDAFAVGALEPRGKTTTALLLVVGSSLPVGKRIDLGAVHGDVLAPRPVAIAGALVVAVPDGAPHGTLLRMARIDDPLDSARITWGAELSEGRDDSDAFAMDAGGTSTLVAWDDWDEKARHGVVRVAVFVAGDVAKPSAPLVVSGDHEDAEAPAVVARQGGFWVAWIVNVKRAPAKKDRREPSDPAETPELEMGPRYVALVPVDDAGKLTGAPAAATPKDGHVVGFDLAGARDGGALVTWRDERAAPGTAGGTVDLVIAHPDGSFEPRVITDDDVGPGTPSLTVDPAPAGVRAFLTVTDDADALRLVSLDEDGHALDDLAVEPSLGLATLLAARHGQVLVSRPAGKGLDLDIFGCVKGRKASEPPR